MSGSALPGRALRRNGPRTALNGAGAELSRMRTI